MRRQVGILVLVSAVVCLIAVLGTNLLRELRVLATAEIDNQQWTISQVETETANLALALGEALAEDKPDSQTVRRRTDIALSRLLLIRRGEIRDLFGPEADDIFEQVAAYEGAAIDILDRNPELNRDDIAALRDLTRQLRPFLRRLVLMGLEAGIEHAQERRARFAAQLTWTASLAIALILGLSVLLVVLDRLLRQARRDDEKLTAGAAQLRSTVEASLDAIVTANEAGEVVEFNSAAERIFGWSRAEVLGRKIDNTIIPHRHRDTQPSRTRRYTNSQLARFVDAGRVELAALRKSGEEFPVELNITSVIADGGELFIAYLRDISQRKINEQKLIDARDRAESMDRAKSQFLAVMSHEMRTPLNGILGVLDLLRQTKLNKQQERYVRVASASGEILLEHVNEALDITRIEMGSMQVSHYPFELRQIVGNATDVLTPLAQEKGLDLTLTFDPGVDRSFDGDGGRIGQILTNLIGNAIKFTDAGAITVNVHGIHSADQTILTVEVSDSGQGIPADKLEDIFEDFVALTHSQGRQVRGDGLGLSISRKVARLMGGDLSVQSQMGKGSTFTLRVPLNRDGAGALTPNATPARATPNRQPAQNILIVEDNAINRSVLRDMLEGAGQNVSEAADGLQGLSAAQTQAYDLIIMDISMPVMDGIEAVRRIRSEKGPNKTTRIIGLTAHGREEYRDRAHQAGMDGFFTKPIRLAALRAVIERKAPATATAPAISHPNADDTWDRAVFDDLTGTLGPDKARATAEIFFTEADAALAQLAAGTSNATAELHKLRGGAAMLGLTGLIAQIDQTSEESGNAPNIKALQTAMERNRARLAAAADAATLKA